MIFFLLVLAGLMLAFANGANDNFKGVATLYGSGVTSYRRALAWATVTTLLGSLLAVVLAHGLLTRFSGKGLVEETLTIDPHFLAAIGLGAALTVLLASRIGMPTSTTNSLIGALCGTALAASSSIQWDAKGSGFVLPLLFSPLIAIAATCTVYPMLRGLRSRLGVTKQTCFCVGSKPVELVPLLSYDVALERAEQLTASLGTVVTCQEAYDGKLLGISSARALDNLHYLSSELVNFARGLNDTPKIAALLLVVPALDSVMATVLCGLAIAVGGVVAARRVAETMSRRITTMNAGQGFTSNLITGLLVVAASRVYHARLLRIAVWFGRRYRPGALAFHRPHSLGLDHYATASRAARCNSVSRTDDLRLVQSQTSIDELGTAAGLPNSETTRLDKPTVSSASTGH